MRNKSQSPSRAQTSGAAREREVVNVNERLAFSFREAGRVVGKSATYIYRQVYAGKLKPIADSGRMMISRMELDRFLARGAEYNPKPKTRLEVQEAA